MFERVEHANIDLKDLAEVRSSCFKRGTMIEERSEGENSVVANDHVAVIDYLFVYDFHEAVDSLIVQLAERQVKAEKLACERIEQRILV